MNKGTIALRAPTPRPETKRPTVICASSKEASCMTVPTVNCLSAHIPEKWVSRHKRHGEFCWGTLDPRPDGLELDICCTLRDLHRTASKDFLNTLARNRRLLLSTHPRETKRLTMTDQNMIEYLRPSRSLVKAGHSQPLHPPKHLSRSIASLTYFAEEHRRMYRHSTGR